MTFLKPQCLVTHVLPLSAGQASNCDLDGPTFHCIVEGACRLQSDGAAPHDLEQGDFVLLLRSERPTLRALRDRTLLLSGTIQSSGLDLTQALPDIPSICKSRMESRESLQSQVLPLVTDKLVTDRQGGIALANVILSLVLTETIREELRSLPLDVASWLSGMQDEALGPVLSAMLREPEAPWTVEKLASAGCMSRSTFARRFREVVGESPMDVLTAIRMRIATDLLQSSHGLKSISRQSGYGSISAFTSAFRKRYGITPSQFRKNSLIRMGFREPLESVID
ncbi:AraC family transcriptional regulator [Blastopirellula sp. JC733]|nr:AraC family transcriptional regulator [Blastopirellula sediminis]